MFHSYRSLSHPFSVFEDVTVYKTRIKGAWFRGIRVMFKGCKFADNMVCVFGSPVITSILWFVIRVIVEHQRVD